MKHEWKVKKNLQTTHKRHIKLIELRVNTTKRLIIGNGGKIFVGETRKILSTNFRFPSMKQ